MLNKESKAVKRSNKPRDLKKFKQLKGLSITISLYAQTVLGGVTRSVFKITAEDTTTGRKILGCCLEKTKQNLDIFLKYALANIAGTENSDNIFTAEVETDTAFSIEHKRTSKTVIPPKLSMNKILRSLYRELLLSGGNAEINGHFETKDAAVPPILADAFIKDFGRIVESSGYFTSKAINPEEKKLFSETLDEIACETKEIENKFEFGKALFVYNRLIPAARFLNGPDDVMTARFELKKAKIYFYLKEYNKCIELLRKCKEIFEKTGYETDLGESCYYLGMTDFYFNSRIEAQRYFSKAAKLLSKSSNADNVFLRNRSKVRRYLLSGNYQHALTAVSSAIRFASQNTDVKEKAYLYGLKAEIYLWSMKYSLAEDALLIQYEHAVHSGDILIEAKCLTQMFQLIPFTGVSGDEELKERIARVKHLSDLCGKEEYYYCCLASAGVHYYSKEMYKEAEKYLSKALKIFRPGTADTANHIFNMIYLAKIRVDSKNYLSAIRVLFRILRLCEDFSIKTYPAYIQNLIGRIGYETKKYKNALSPLRKCLNLMKKEKISDHVLEINTLKLAGLCRIGLNDNIIAAKYLNSALKLITKPKLPFYIGKEDDICEIKETLRKISNQF